MQTKFYNCFFSLFKMDPITNVYNYPIKGKELTLTEYLQCTKHGLKAIYTHSLI